MTNQTEIELYQELLTFIGEGDNSPADDDFGVASVPIQEQKETEPPAMAQPLEEAKATQDASQPVLPARPDPKSPQTGSLAGPPPRAEAPTDISPTNRHSESAPEQSHVAGRAAVSAKNGSVPKPPDRLPQNDSLRQASPAQPEGKLPTTRPSSPAPETAPAKPAPPASLCPECGKPSGLDDLICIACGAFIG